MVAQTPLRIWRRRTWALRERLDHHLLPPHQLPPTVEQRQGIQAGRAQRLPDARIVGVAAHLLTPLLQRLPALFQRVLAALEVFQFDQQSPKRQASRSRRRDSPRADSRTSTAGPWNWESGAGARRPVRRRRSASPGSRATGNSGLTSAARRRPQGDLGGRGGVGYAMRIHQSFYQSVG